MTRAYILDPVTLATQGLVDQSWEKLEYTRRYWGMDTFQLTINRNRLYASTIQKGRLLFLPDEGNRVFLIEQIQTTQEGSRANDTMVVAGRSLEGIAMAERAVIPTAGQDYDLQSAVPAETAIKHYVTNHAGTGAAADRQIPNLNVVASGGAGTTLTVAGRYQYVFDICKQIGLVSGLGWEIKLNTATSKFDFNTVNGVDRHASVFFDFAFETLEKWDELDSILDSKTVAIVAGQGEGAARDIVTRPVAAPTGFSRREAFVDARDIDYGATSQLQVRGDAFLAAATKETRLEATVHQYGAFRYLTHWDMGDLVLIRNQERGISYTARVVEVRVAFSESASAPEVTAVIDRPFPTLQEQADGPGASGGATDYPISAPPIGPAGGDLSGTYPNPSVVDNSHLHDSTTVTTHSTAHAHASLTGIGIDDHHAKSHVHNADGSGTVAHSSLSGIGADDHHARLHDHSNALDGTNLNPLLVGALSTVGGTAQTVAAGGSTTALAWGTRTADTGTSYNTTNKDWTVPTGKGGVYRVSASVNNVNQTNAVNAMVRFQVNVNGTATAIGGTIPSEGGTNVKESASGDLILADGDKISVSGQALVNGADISLSFISITRLGSGYQT